MHRMIDRISNSGHLKAHRWSSLLIFMLCLILTVALALLTHKMIQQDEEVRFQRISSHVLEAIQNKLKMQQGALLATRGLFNASENVEENEFKKFINGLQLYDRFPGIGTIGYIESYPLNPRVKFFFDDTANLDQSRIQQELGSNLALQETMDHVAAQRKSIATAAARIPTLSPPHSELGFYLFVPVFKTEAHDSPLIGFIFSPFISESLIQQIVLDFQTVLPKIQIFIRVESGDQQTSLVSAHNEFAASPPFSIFGHEDIHHLKSTISFAGRTWDVELRTLPGFELKAARRLPLYLLALGSVISFLIFFVLLFAGELNERLVTDLENRKRSEKEILIARGAAEDANKAKSRFLANISHEIRTPLGVITGYADLALERLSGQPEILRYLETIKRNGEQLTALIGEVLDLSKIEADKLQVELIRFSFPELLDEVVNSFSLKAESKGTLLQWEKSHPIPEFITSDPTRLRQILSNLIENAIKFTSRGMIQISPRLSQLSEDKSSSEVEIQIKDSGIGISDRQKKVLFRPFVQADPSMTRRYGGTGLGLCLSQQLARALKGDVLLKESQPGQGSTFCIQISAGPFEGYWNPRDAKIDPRKKGQLNESKKAMTGLKVLLAEDSEDVQALIRQYLIDAGADVDLASDGVEAVSKAESVHFDVILMDIQMPKMDGHHATQKLRTDGFKMPIIALTAHAFQEERNRALSGGFSGYLTKPISRFNLLNGISAAL